jgi:aminopeptidase
MDNELLKKFARLAVVGGVNVQKGQLLVISAPVGTAAFVRQCAQEAYEAGAGQVMVNWDDEVLTHMNFQYQDQETLSEFPDYLEEKVRYTQEKKGCFLHILSETPGLLADIDPAKIQAAMLTRHQRLAPYQAYTMNNLGQWCIIALPSEAWAQKVFPEKSAKEAVAALGSAILQTSRVTADEDPLEAWRRHDAELAEHCRIMNEYQFTSLHFTSRHSGTDLVVGLPERHVWAGGASQTPEGVVFNPNIPTEECFCMPHREKVDGIVYASKPLAYQGKLIEDFWFRFENGRVVDFGAAQGKEPLQNLLDTDEGSRHLGEVSLISYHSPISQLGLLFYNTLFDENASCHLALGACYPENLAGGTALSKDELKARGGNDSMNHVDFMFGTDDLSVVGTRADGSLVTVFADGDFAF